MSVQLNGFYFVCYLDVYNRVFDCFSESFDIFRQHILVFFQTCH